MPSKRYRARIDTSSSKHETTKGNCTSEANHVGTSNCETDKGQELPDIRSLYYLLVSLSLKEPIKYPSNDSASDLDHLERRLDLLHTELKVQRMHGISRMFSELNVRFRRLLSELLDVSASSAHEKNDTGELTIILRCCMVMLIFLGDHDLLMENGKEILSLLNKLISVSISKAEGNSVIGIEKLVTHTSASVETVSTCILEPADSYRAILCALLEVILNFKSGISSNMSGKCCPGYESEGFVRFRCILVSADELLVHKYLREYLMWVDSASENIFMHHFGPGVLGCVLELISAHFIISVSNDRAHENFIGRLYCLLRGSSTPIEMSLSSSLTLLLNPIMLSAPKILQAYQILMVSESIGINMPSDKRVPDWRLMCYNSTAFEKSVSLYSRYAFSSLTNGQTSGGNFLEKSSRLKTKYQQEFETLLSPATREKLANVIEKTNDLWNFYISKMSSSTTSDMMTLCNSYVKDTLPSFNSSYEKETSSILTCIMQKVSSNDGNDSLLLGQGKISPEDMYLVASIVKLMSCSMLQVIQYSTHRGNPGAMKTSVYYDAVIDIISCFRHFAVDLPVQKFLCTIMESRPSRHKESKWMLFHFAGLLSLSYASRIDFLVKDCIFAIITVLSLFIFEEGNLDALSLMMHQDVESDTSPEVGKVDKKRSDTAASNFQKSRTHLRCSLRISIDGSTDIESGIEDEADQSCNGERFMGYAVKCSAGSSDVSDITDFIQCQSGKDYSYWLKNREKFKQWRFKKAVLKRKKKKMETLRLLLKKRKVCKC